MASVNYELIILARESIGITQAEFSEILQVEQSTISKIENGLIPPSEETIKKISSLLEFPESFFYQDWKPVRVEGHYRKKITAPIKILKECKAKMTLVEWHLSKLVDAVELPTVNFPSWDVAVDGSPTLCAQYVRQYWKLPKGKIENLTNTLEDNGAVIVELDMDGIEGFSTFSKDNVPLIFINKNKPGDRDLLTKAHEAGHYIMHFGKKISEDRDIDKEAMEFASEFLVPIADVEDQLLQLSLGKLADLKRYWKISMAAFIYKAKSHNIITKNQYDYIWKQMVGAGYKITEPVVTPREKATMFQEILNTYLNDFNYSKTQLSKIIQFKENKIDEWYYDKNPNKLKIIRRAS